MTRDEEHEEIEPGGDPGPLAHAGAGRVGVLLVAVHAVILAVVCFACYHNAYDHAFNLDSGHSILENRSVRDLRKVPAYFVDASHFSTLRTNVDYRPALLTSFAINHLVARTIPPPWGPVDPDSNERQWRRDGYHMFWWHAGQIALHLVCVLALYALCRRIALLVPRLGEHDEASAWVAFASAAVFAAHPVNAGVVDYLSARSSLLAAAFLLPAILAYMVPEEHPRYGRVRWFAAVLYGLALFTKVEAIAALGVFLLYDVWQTARRREHRSGFFVDLVLTARLDTLKRLAPSLAITGVYFVAQKYAMADFDYGATSRRADVTSLDYLLTQTVAWWYYVRHWFAPVDLVGDDASFPISRSLYETTTLLAVAAWLVVVSVLLCAWRRWPHLLFLAAGALALLSPTSSIVPLAEMVNEHRPYAPLALLSLVWMIPLGQLVTRLGDGRPIQAAVVGLGVALVVIALGRMTWERNRVFATEESYWADVVEKAPAARAYVNYGLVFMGRGEYQRALDLYERALPLAPGYYITHTNMAIALDNLGNTERAAYHYDQAVHYDSSAGSALTYRGQFHLKHERFAEARADFEASLPVSLRVFRNRKGLATAAAGLGDGAACAESILACWALDPAATGTGIVAMITPFFTDASRYAAGVECFEILAPELPEVWWVHANLGTLYHRTGQADKGKAAQAKAEALKAAEEE